jgi:uncharacterized protein YjbI with pentapeptide repeats
MSAFFEKLFQLKPDTQERLGSTLGRAKSVNEFFGDVIEAVKDTDLPKAIEQALPWDSSITEPIVGALADAVPPVKFVVKLFEGLTKEEDPGKLGYLACTLAYQQAVQQALPEVVGDGAPFRGKTIRTNLREATPPERYDFRNFSFATALQHPFIKDSDKYLHQFAEHLNLGDSEFLKLQNEVHVRFLTNLKLLLNHGKTRKKFEPFTGMMAMGSEEERARDALLRHADYQRWLFEEKSVLGREPFALKHVYVETDCGKLPWGTIDEARERARLEARGRESLLDPFQEQHGGRQPLIETILSLIAGSTFTEAIVVQGTAGAGKSSMTLRLCYELVRQGLRPIRIELKDLDTRESTPVAEALPSAVRLTDKDRDPDADALYFGKGLFLGKRIFDEHVLFRGTKICPYVLILDGWDEISISASRGYQQQVDRMLADVRQEFLERRAFPVRVILTGRPTDAVEKSRFLYQKTEILTVRPLTPEQLRTFVDQLKEALVQRPVPVERPDAWTLGKIERHPEIFDRYRADYEAAKEYGTGRLGVLGLPLLAHLAFRLMAEWPGDSPLQLLDETTVLYRSLVDLVIQGGKPQGAAISHESGAHISGSELRALLRGTAEAMTALGRESIAYDELALRLDWEAARIQELVERLDKEQILSRLMISFFFKGGYKELGCEFSHKSFREYLFAEAIVERLKEYGRLVKGPLPERNAEKEYWKDFDPQDPRYALSRALGEPLGLSWIMPEVGRHLSRLLEWEIARAAGQDPYPVVGEPTPGLGLDGWRSIRDALADLWDWWGEGVHLRWQPSSKKGYSELNWVTPYAVEIAQADRPRVRAAGDPLPIPTRIVTIDAHLGDGLFRLAADVHWELACREGWLDPEQSEPDASVPSTTLRKTTSESDRDPRRYQSSFTRGESTWVLFSPSGINIYYFNRYVYRINSAGYRPFSDFPGASRLRGAVLRGADLSRANLSRANLSRAVLIQANLSRTDLSRAVLIQADLIQADLIQADLSGAVLSRADLRGAVLRGADLSRADLSRAVLIQADLSGADLRQAILFGASLSGADLSGAILGGADLSKADLSRADLRGADLSDADLSEANLSEASLSGADLSRANLSDAKVSKQQLDSAHTGGARGLDDPPLERGNS